ncbi:cholesterol 25-hydroxylase-like protein 1, member 2 [Ptychodera flava]|uniref:cholesterol 25-hydroxylase-like protein 1, member 2 n=1 Tax=Ptychodera flava TaxID=63121 RepID=UPI003969FEFF
MVTILDFANMNVTLPHQLDPLVEHLMELYPKRSLIQPVWDLVLNYVDHDFLRSPLFPIVLNVVFYFVACLPFMLFDLYGTQWNWIQRYKLQPKQKVSMPQVFDTLGLTFWNQIVFILPVSIGQWIYTPPTPLPPEAPGLWEFCWQIVAALLVFDLEYFIWHYCHHKNRWLYKHVHSVHHRYHSPFSWVTQYLHPWELISVGIFVTTTPWIFKSHPMTTWSFMMVSIIVSVEAHIGFDFPWALNHWCPFGLWGGAPKHDMHHLKPLSNFQPFFTHWDRLFGTECPGWHAGGITAEQWEEMKKKQA